MKGPLGVIAIGALLACNQAATEQPVPGIVRIDGSSTLHPLTQAVVQAFTGDHPGRHFKVTISGTAHGFDQLCSGRTDVSAAGRPIRRPEIEACHKAGVPFIELPVAYDGIAVVVHPRAAWIDDITVEELRRLWQPEAQGRVQRWTQIRPQWPDRPIHLFGADARSGTFDYFTAAINGEEGASRHDFTGSVSDDELVEAVARDVQAMAFIPLAYYKKNRPRLKIVAVNSGAHPGRGPIVPSVETIRAGAYQPLARPLFIYVRKQALNSPAVSEFVDFYLERAGQIAERLGYISLTPEVYQLAAERRRTQWTGTIFGEGGSQVGLTMNGLLEKARLQ